jgi:glutamate dehydrogenase
LDVLAGLSLTDAEHSELMTFKPGGQPSAFYQSYVQEIQRKIGDNAALESACIWREYDRLNGSKPRCQISDELSVMITDLQDELEASDLFDDMKARQGVLRQAIPETLAQKLTLEKLMERLPEPYQRALFASWVASHFIYKCGVKGSNVDFYRFASHLATKAA